MFILSKTSTVISRLQVGTNSEETKTGLTVISRLQVGTNSEETKTGLSRGAERGNPKLKLNHRRHILLSSFMRGGLNI